MNFFDKTKDKLARWVISCVDRSSVAQQVNDLEQRLEQRANEISSQISSLSQEVRNIRQEQKYSVDIVNTRAAALLAAGWQARRDVIAANDSEASLNEYRPAEPMPLKESLKQLEALDPRSFPVWQRLFQNGIESYEKDIETSISHWDQTYARLFGGYVLTFAKGRLLDVGCGTNGMPSYLAGYPLDLVSGIDPRTFKGDPPFEFAQGFNELLPWPDRSFETVVSGTSLDHVLSLAKSFEEVRRVLVPGGRYLIWLASIPGSKPYTPEAEDFEPVDQFHLFHFDRAWIEPILKHWFEIEDVTVIPQAGFDHVFYALRSAQK